MFQKLSFLYKCIVENAEILFRGAFDICFTSVFWTSQLLNPV